MLPAWLSQGFYFYQSQMKFTVNSTNLNFSCQKKFEDDELCIVVYGCWFASDIFCKIAACGPLINWWYGKMFAVNFCVSCYGSRGNSIGKKLIRLDWEKAVYWPLFMLANTLSALKMCIKSHYLPSRNKILRRSLTLLWLLDFTTAYSYFNIQTCFFSLLEMKSFVSFFFFWTSVHCKGGRVKFSKILRRVAH